MHSILITAQIEQLRALNQIGSVSVFLGCLVVLYLIVHKLTPSLEKLLDRRLINGSVAASAAAAAKVAESAHDRERRIVDLENEIREFREVIGDVRSIKTIVESIEKYFNERHLDLVQRVQRLEESRWKQH